VEQPGSVCAVPVNVIRLLMQHTKVNNRIQPNSTEFNRVSLLESQILNHLVSEFGTTGLFLKQTASGRAGLSVTYKTPDYK
jgi:hypothetical protein